MSGGERPAYYTPEQLAALWQCDRTTVRRRCASGEIRAFRIGDLWRIPAEAVAEFEARTMTGPEPKPEPTPVRRQQHEQASEYVAVVPGVVPWRSEVVDAASPAAGRGRTTGTKRAGRQRA